MARLEWKTPLAGRVAHVRWSEWIDSRRRIDPYLVWADLSSFAGYGGAPNEGRTLPILVEWTGAPVFEGPGMAPVMAELDVPGIFKPPVPFGNRLRATLAGNARFFTARVSRWSLESLLNASESIRRFQLGVPRVPDTDTLALQFLDLAAGVDFIPDVVVGVVDDACAFAHTHFLEPPERKGWGHSPGSTRVRYLWDQGRTQSDQKQSRQSDDADWKPAGGLGYGSELAGRAMDSHVAPPGGSGRQQNAPYRDTESYRAEWLESTHGTGVADLAGGRIAPLRNHDQATAGHPAPAGSRDSLAGQAPMVVVQLPIRAVLDTSGGSLGVHLLDAVKYIVARADSIHRKGGVYEKVLDDAQPTGAAPDGAAAFGLPPLGKPPAGMPRCRVVVTLSLGSIAGPHDGSSMIEEALRELIEREQRLAIVVAAGNAHGSRTHAAVSLMPANEALPQPQPEWSGQRAVSQLAPDSFHDLAWHLPPDNPHESYLEVWIEGDDHRGVLLEVRPPGDADPCLIDCGSVRTLAAVGASDSEVPMAAVVYPRRVAQGLHGTMALIAVGPTRPHSRHARNAELEPPYAPIGDYRDPVPRPAAPCGEWIVSVVNRLSTPVRVHMWTERNDLIGVRRRRQQATLSDVSGRSVAADYSLSSLANGPPLEGPGGREGGLIVVGGYRISDQQMAGYSSGGPARPPSARVGVDVEAPSDMGPALPGLRVAGARSSSIARLGGTSAAAPLLARWIADRADRWHTQTELAALLRELEPVVPQPLKDAPPWPERLPQDYDDVPRHGKRRLDKP